MPKQTVGTNDAPNGGRTKWNENFDELYARLTKLARRASGRYGKLNPGDFFDQGMNGQAYGVQFSPVNSLMFVPLPVLDRDVTIDRLGYDNVTAKTITGADTTSGGLYVASEADEYALTKVANVAANITGAATTGSKVQTIAYTLLAFESYYAALHVAHDGNYRSLTGVGSVTMNLSGASVSSHFRMFRTTQTYALSLPATFTLTPAMRTTAEAPSVRMRVAA